MRIAVCSPTFDQPTDFVHPTPITELAKEIGGYTPFTGGCSPHDRSRGMIQARAMQTEAEAFFWIDSDIRATIEQCRALVDAWEEVRRIGAQTVTGVYVCRHHASQGEVAFNFNLRIPQEGEPDFEVKFGPEGELFRITSHGFGFCIISRECLEKMVVPACEYEEGIAAKAWWLPEVVAGAHLGEDRSFTWRIMRAWARGLLPAQGLGWPMYLDSRICVEHGGWRVQQ